MNKIWIIVTLLVAGWLRFYNLDWDQGHYLHPDERLYVNASNVRLPGSLKEFFSPTSPLNPHMFYYGALPLYVYVFFSKLITANLGWKISFLVLSRAISASVSLATVAMMYPLARKFLSRRDSWLTMLILALSVGHFQHAHFITTESWLTLEAVLVTYFSLLFLEEKKSQKKWLWAGLAGLAWGAGIATKIIGLSFGIIPITAGIVGGIGKIRETGKFRVFWGFGKFGVFCVTAALLAGVVGSPYNLIDYRSFWREQSYMQGVTVGKFKPPFIIIYEGTKPYLYQLTKILPWVWGPSLMLGVFGVIGEIKKKRIVKWLVLLIWPAAYFLAAGAWYAKFSRYMVPPLPFGAILAGKGAGFFLKQQRKFWESLRKLGILGILGGQIIYAGIFVREVYGREHTRIAASRWIYQNIPAGAVICGEHWDDNLPLSVEGYGDGNYKKVELAVYDDDNQQKIDTLLNKTAACDYIVLSSRRVWYSIIRNPDKYPFTSNFYRDLFDERAGFKLVHEERRLNDDWADETFQSYDHPPVWMFKKI